MESTRIRILDEALTLFSQYGFDAVSVAMIAEAVGIKAPSLYKHYKSKQDIFTAIKEEMQRRYELHSANLQIDGSHPEQDEQLYAMMNESTLVEIGQAQFLFFLKDSYQCRFRKLLVIEQFHSPDLAKQYMKQYYDDAIAYQSFVFAMLCKRGVLKNEAPDIMALHFFAPIYLLLNLCDAQPDRYCEAAQQVEAHIRQFVRIYSNNGATS